MLLASFDKGQDALRTITTQRAGLQRTAEEAAALHAQLDVALVSFSETRSPEVGLAAAGVAEIQVAFTLSYSRYRSLSLKLSNTRVYEPQIRARLGTTAHFCREAKGTLRHWDGANMKVLYLHV